MNKKYYSQFFYLLAVLPALLYFSSCTYDYFEDETNYEIYVPKADQSIRTETYSIKDLSIFIYNDELYKERYSYTPFTENPRSKLGNFNFRLYPGTYNVYCFTNLEDILFQDLNTYSTARFDLQKSTDGTYYKEPSAIYVEYKTPTIQFPGPVVSDTAFFERKYVGRICIAFKNLYKLESSLTYTNIKKIEIEASGIGVTQYLSALTDSVNTRSSRNDASDIMRLSAETFLVKYKDFEFGVQNYYFPSPDLSGEGYVQPMELKLTFFDQSGNAVSFLKIPFIEKTGIPIVLHMNETRIIEVDGNNIQILKLDDLEPWNPIIEDEDDSGPGGGGIGV